MFPFRRESEKPEPRPLPSFEEAAAEIRRNGQDASKALVLLGEKLSADLPDQTHVYETQDYVSVSVRFGGDEYRLLWRPNEGLHAFANVGGEHGYLPCERVLGEIHRRVAAVAQEQTRALDAIEADLEGRPPLADVDEPAALVSGEIELGLSHPSALTDRRETGL